MTRSLEFDVEPRFSDYNGNGYLKDYKILTFLEKARFAIAEDMNIFKILGSEDYYFPVIEVDYDYLKPIKQGQEIVLRTELQIPVVPRLVFRHEVVDKKTNEKYITAKTVVAIVSNSKGLMLGINEDIREKIRKYICNE